MRSVHVRSHVTDTVLWLDCRPYNIQQCVDAFLGYASVKGVEYAPEKNPTRLVSRASSRSSGRTDSVSSVSSFQSQPSNCLTPPSFLLTSL